MAAGSRISAEGPSSRSRLRFVLAPTDIWWVVTCAALVTAGILWRAQTLHLDNYASFAFGHLAYSDILGLYGGHDLDSHHIPYAQQTDIEYPVVMGLVMWVTAFAPGVDGYFWANAALMLTCALASLVILSRLIPSAGLWRFALAPMLWSYSMLNWDFLSILELVAAIYFISRKRFGWAGVMLALGTWTKLYPGFALSVVLAYSLRVDAGDGTSKLPPGLGRLLVRDSPPVRLLLGFAAITVALNLPFAIANFSGWFYPLQHQGARDINPDSIWNHIPGIHLHLVNLWFPVLFGFGILWLALRTWWGDRWDAGMLLSILLFLLFTKDFSPQYDIWVLPLLTFLLCPLWLWLAFTIADLAYYAGIFWWYYHYYGGTFPVSIPDADKILGVTVWGREGALALIAAWALWIFVDAEWPPGMRKAPMADVDGR